MPVYPALMALLYRPEMSDEEFFALGKKVGIGVALAVLAVSFFVFLRYVPFLETLTAIEVVAFTIFVYKAPYFQPEILFYGLTFLLFILMIELIWQPRFTVAILAGAVGGLAHLTKASVLPGIVLCCLCLFLRGGLELWERHSCRDRSGQESTSHRIWFHRLKPLFAAGLLAAAFLLVVFPYIRTSKLRFGHYFYNVNSTFYMWYDSWAEAVDGTRAHGDRKGWPDMPPDQIPSLSKYLHDHSTQQIVARFVNGADTIRKNVVKSYGYAPFLLLYFLLVAMLVFQNREYFIHLAAAKTTAILLFFILSYFAAYLALYAWYVPIASGNRFVLNLLLPALFLLVRVIDHASKRDLCIHIFGRRVQASAASPLILIALVAYVLLIFPDQISRLYGGK